MPRSIQWPGCRDIVRIPKPSDINPEFEKELVTLLRKYAMNKQEKTNVLKKHQLTKAQMEILCRAVRTPEGTVLGHGVRQATLDTLKARGLIALEPLHKDREARTAHAETLIKSAFQLARWEPHATDKDGLQNWKAVLIDLLTAKNNLDSLSLKCLRITAAGRGAVAEWVSE